MVVMVQEEEDIDGFGSYQIIKLKPFKQVKLIKTKYL